MNVLKLTIFSINLYIYSLNVSAFRLTLKKWTFFKSHLKWLKINIFMITTLIAKNIFLPWCNIQPFSKKIQIDTTGKNKIKSAFLCFWNCSSVIFWMNTLYSAHIFKFCETFTKVLGAFYFDTDNFLLIQQAYLFFDIFIEMIFKIWFYFLVSATFPKCYWIPFWWVMNFWCCLR